MTPQQIDALVWYCSTKTSVEQRTGAGILSFYLNNASALDLDAIVEQYLQTHVARLEKIVADASQKLDVFNAAVTALPAKNGKG